MNILLTIILWFSSQPDTLRLEECHQLALSNYPITRQHVLYEEATKLRLQNIDAKKLPQVMLNGQATYQSAVATVPISLPNVEIPSPPKDQYKVAVEITQSLYDGGMNRYGKESERARLASDHKSIEVEHQNLKGRVNATYFTVLLYQQNEALMDTTLQILDAKRKQMEARLQSGVILQSELNKIMAEILRSEQKKVEIRSERLAYLQILSNFIGMAIHESTILEMPDAEVDVADTSLNRPETALFELQRQRLTVNERLVKASYAPKFALYGQTGYGRPNPFNFFDTNGDFYYLAGIRASWNILNWNTLSREKALLKVQSEIIRTQKENFDVNLENSLTKDIADIQKLEELLQKDDDIIKLQSEIVAQSSIQVDNGVITATDYLSDINEESRAKLTRNLHQVQLSQAKINFLTNLGKI